MVIDLEERFGDMLGIVQPIAMAFVDGEGVKWTRELRTSNLERWSRTSTMFKQLAIFDNAPSRSRRAMAALNITRRH